MTLANFLDTLATASLSARTEPPEALLDRLDLNGLHFVYQLFGIACDELSKQDPTKQTCQYANDLLLARAIVRAAWQVRVEKNRLERN